MIARRKPLPRSQKPIARSAPKKRGRSAKERLRIYGPKGYVEWCKVQTCVACRHSQRCDVAHIQTGGTGRKDDWTRTVPLCSAQSYRAGCHWQMHTLGRESFEDLHGIDLTACAKATQLAWRASQGDS